MIPDPLCAPCLDVISSEMPITDVHGFAPSTQSFNERLRFAREGQERYGSIKTTMGDQLGIIPRTLIDNTLMCAYCANRHYGEKRRR